MIKMFNGEYGHYGDGDGGIVMLASIVDMVMKGGTGIGAWPDFRGYLCSPSLRTYSWSGHLGLTV